MTDAVKNVRCSTLYLDIAKNSSVASTQAMARALDSRGIVACESGLQSDVVHYQAARQKIHR